MKKCEEIIGEAQMSLWGESVVDPQSQRGDLLRTTLVGSEVNQALLPFPSMVLASGGMGTSCPDLVVSRPSAQQLSQKESNS